jgi:hypothetical protein
LKKLIAALLVVTIMSVFSIMPVCAQDTAQTTTVTPKNPKLAGLMSSIVPLTGQWYNGQLFTLKSAAMALAEGGSIFVLAFFAARSEARGVAFAGMGGMILTHTWSGLDAYLSAKTINKGLALQLDEKGAYLSYNIPF